ncbi:DUF72 domain-containing protein [Paenibacillus massiliensis]|uniref:DUF72 domain-containing protein n=1 Tax=Paenibacillus massiliensis TaxID=225917 RepID=UPI00041901A6|nr:DUF72 domain-containing protein [Paenibacillus massiliensis]
MIHVGLTGWGDHESLEPYGTKPSAKLYVYGTHFPIVELDSSFYAVQPAERMAKWAAETPEGFSFIVKAYQGMTGHTRGKIPYFTSEEDMYHAFLQSIAPMVEVGKLKAVLFQYPPWFDCTFENVQILRDTRSRMKDIPCIVEFRHQSWYADEFCERTLAFLSREQWRHSVCDEPQAGLGSIPIVPKATHPELTLVRLHGRNVSGWNQSDAPNWREVRYLYNYNEQELTDWKHIILELQQQCKEVCVIFNNNSGGHAAANAKQLMTLLGMNPKPLPVRLAPEDGEDPEQMSLF